jgi:hypothetical protein
LSLWGATPTCHKHFHFRYRCRAAERVKNAWQTLIFLYAELNPAHQKYSAHDRELLAICEAVKHFCHMLEAHHFIIFTDHKVITYAFQQKRDKYSPRQFNLLSFLAQSTIDI